MLRNRGNFLRWYDTANETTWNRWTFDEDCHVGTPLMLPEEEYSFYVNTPDKVELPSGTNYLKDRAGNTVATGVLTVNSVDFDGPGGGSHSFGTITIPENTPSGLYYLQVDTWKTNLIEVIDSADRTLLIAFGNKASIANVLFEYQDENYRQRFRIRGYIKDRQPFIKASEREETTTGLTKSYKKNLRGYRSVVFENLSDDAHEAAAVMFIHDSIEINGQPVKSRVEGAYKVLTNDSEPYSDGEFQVWDDAFGVLNVC